MTKAERLQKQIELQYMHAYVGVAFPEKHKKYGSSATWLLNASKKDEREYKEWLLNAGYTNEDITELQHKAKYLQNEAEGNF